MNPFFVRPLRLHFVRPMARLVLCTLVISIAIGLGQTARAKWLTEYKGFDQAFGYDPSKPPAAFSIRLIGSNVPANVLWPGEESEMEFQIVNANAKEPLKTNATLTIVQYGTRTIGNDVFAQEIFKIGDIDSVKLPIDIPAGGAIQQKVKLPIPAKFGAYAIVMEVEGQGKQVAASCIRTPAASPGKVQYPSYACDVQDARIAPLFQRIGIKATRIEWGYSPTGGPAGSGENARLATYLKALQDADITVLVTISTGGDTTKMPLGNSRSFLNEKDEGPMGYPGDMTMLPQYDEDFQKWNKELVEQFGWPKGPVNAIELWNEPWEGSSISGWGGDLPRYRELFTRMAQGIEEGRKSSGAQVLIGGACSSMNTEDKLFPDGKDDYLKWLDFNSIHYQPMHAMPVLIKKWQERQSPNGPVQTWDTESWIANSEDRVAAVIASMRAQGQTRTAGVQHDVVRDLQEVDVRLADGTTKHASVLQPLPAAGAVAATQGFIGERKFREVLFKNGLPWVFVFDGLKNEDDGSVVVVGDLGGVYERDMMLFHSVFGLEANKRIPDLRKKIESLPPDAPSGARQQLINEYKLAQVLDKASMTLADGGGIFMSFDSYGNPIPSTGGKIVVPLDGLGYFIRSDGSPGSFAKLLDAIRASRIEGYEPLDVIAHDLSGRVESKPALKLSLTNILNRPISGKLEVKLGNLTLDGASQTIEFKPWETKEISLNITGGATSPDNSYPLTLTFDAGADGIATHEETMHVNVIPRREIVVDGKLEDWKDVLPQPISSQPGAGKNVTEKAWLPFVKFDEQVGPGVASGYMSYDDQNFYFAAKIVDTTPYDGNQRFASRDDDQYFYPAVAYRTEKDPKTGEVKRVQELKWPEGVRRFSYRKGPDLPSGDGTDNVQLAFNVLPTEQTDWLPNPPGTMPRFMVYKTTDYEYALNSVSSKYGGGAEIFRLLAPGVPRKHFYPREPKAAVDGGPVDNGKLSMTREGNTRLVEASLPWAEIPEVKKRLDAGQPIKFSFRVNDNGGVAYELNGGRSVSKINTYAFHDYWSTSWAVETEFTFEK